MVRRGRQRGLTLLEVMIALLIATVGLLGALAMVGALVGGTSFSRAATEATVLAQAKIEQVQSQTGVKLAPLTPSGPQTETDLDASGNVVAGSPYTRVTDWEAAADGLGIEVTVTVSWTDPNGNAHAVRLQTERLPNG